MQATRGSSFCLQTCNLERNTTSQQCFPPRDKSLPLSPGNCATMASAWMVADPEGYQKQSDSQNQRDITTQIVISIALGFFAFLAFCFLRPRWTSLYAARKKQKNAASILPELPDTFFGWIPTLYRITEDQVLASAGLDAFVVSSLKITQMLNA